MMKFFMKFFIFSLLFVSQIAFAGIDIKTWQTSNGSKVMYVYSGQLPMVDIQLKFDAGSARDGENFGLASLTSSLIGTSTKNFTEDQISARFNDVGAIFSTGVGRDSATISLRSLTRDEILSKSLITFSEVAAKAIFDEDILTREINRVILALKQSKVNPSSITSKAMWQGLYANHPYAHAPIGTIATVENLSVADLQAFYNKKYVASNALVSIVGDVSLEQAKEIAEQVTAALNKGKKLPAIPNPKPLVNKVTNIIEFDTTQTHYRLAQIGVERGHEDYVALFVGNHIFGGSGLSSILMEEVRTNRGLAYSTFSFFAVMKVPGPFVIGLSTKNTNAKNADELVKKLLNDFLKDFSEEKLQAIKDNLVGGFPLRVDSNSKILGYISMIGFYDLPLNHLEIFPQQIAKVTKEEVLDAWQRHIVPNKMLTIMVGKPE